MNQKMNPASRIASAMIPFLSNPDLLDLVWAATENDPEFSDDLFEQVMNILIPD